ncbi:hypothetical protein GCM10010423_64940 [Streptomyces levis]|uniref:Uncharacterized protein n=1 Tax=Streptomyces levis TaxID=285566 RepID=A0ABN3P179_9ACTN
MRTARCHNLQPHGDHIWAPEAGTVLNCLGIDSKSPYPHLLHCGQREAHAGHRWGDKSYWCHGGARTVKEEK